MHFQNPASHPNRGKLIAGFGIRSMHPSTRRDGIGRWSEIGRMEDGGSAIWCEMECQPVEFLLRRRRSTCKEEGMANFAHQPLERFIMPPLCAMARGVVRWLSQELLPVKAAGMRRDPPRSEPMPKAEPPAASRAHSPPLLPAMPFAFLHPHQ